MQESDEPSDCTLVPMCTQPKKYSIVRAGMEAERDRLLAAAELEEGKVYEGRVAIAAALDRIDRFNVLKARNRGWNESSVVVTVCSLP